jgi:rare lipoprotein A
MSHPFLRSAAAAALIAFSAPLVFAQAAAASAPAAASAETKPAADAAAATERGKLAWYGSKFAGRRTASGEAYNPQALTMAHKTLPFGTRVKVTNLDNQKSVVLRVNDRGPTQADRIGDVSYAARASSACSSPVSSRPSWW